MLELQVGFCHLIQQLNLKCLRHNEIISDPEAIGQIQVLGGATKTLLRRSVVGYVMGYTPDPLFCQLSLAVVLDLWKAPRWQ